MQTPIGKSSNDIRQYWQARYDAGEHHWDRGEAAPPLAEFLETRRVAGDVLVPGCGSGHDVRLLAAQGARVVGLDIAPGALAMAANHPVVGGERYVGGDFFHLPDSLCGAFDWVFEHTCFCAIDPSRRAEHVESCARALRPCGRLLAIFYLEPRDPGGDGPPWGVSEKEIDGLFGAKFDKLESRIPSRAYDGREGRELLWLGQLKPPPGEGRLLKE